MSIEIEVSGELNNPFDEDMVEDTLIRVNYVLEDTLLLKSEEFQVKMRLFLKLSEELQKLHKTNQIDNFFTCGSWNYVGENLSRRL